ncbi:MAG: type II toxin-antitoxin system HipA family toxin YjjJ [Methylophilaceae bacterium]
MRPTNQIARDRLDTTLSRQAPSSAAVLAKALNVSVATIHRMLRERGDTIVRQGATKNTRYALRRPLRGQMQAFPIYRIDQTGQGHLIAHLELTRPQGSLLNLNNMQWPTDTTHQGWWGGLPYPLYDMRPQGFLGRHFAHHIASDFSVSENPDNWSDDDIVYVLSTRGIDCIGDLIIGNAAYQRWLNTRNITPSAINENALPDQYAQLATNASDLGNAGSSAGGEFPKFTAYRPLSNSQTPHVLVKYSGADASPPVERWSDLLICEHLALTTLAQHTNINAAKSRILFGQGRTFLEVERFDRIGEFGRSPVISLASIDSAFIGSADDNWGTPVTQLVRRGLTTQATIDETLIIAWFGRLIGNTDMHLGNLSFTFEYNENETATLKLTPVYDMLPMLYKPLAGGEVPNKTFTGKLPLPQEQAQWEIAHSTALLFWLTASQDTRISQGFRDICTQNHQQLNALNL